MEGEMKDDNWVFDSMIGFLTSPIWNIPILNFIESKSLVFDPEVATNEEYSVVHEEYKKLVDTMLSNFMQDLGITSEQFEAICKRTTKDANSSVQQEVFEQIWAAENLETFKHLMNRKNLDMQLQALQMFQRKYGQNFDPDSGLTEEINDPVLEEVLKKSLEEYQNILTAIEGEKEALEQTLKLSLAEIQGIETEKMKDKELLENAMARSMKDSEGSASDVTTVNEEVGKETDNIDYEKESSVGVTPEAVALRQKYLRQQRDKLADMKRKQRVQQMEGLMQENAIGRPNSSKAAKEMLERDDTKLEYGSSNAVIDNNTLAARRALAARLRNEVIGNATQ